MKKIVNDRLKAFIGAPCDTPGHKQFQEGGA